MKYSLGSGIIRCIGASKTFSKFRMLRSSVRFEVPCVSKFRVLRSSVRFEVPYDSKFRALRSSVRFEVLYASKFRALRSSVRFEVPYASKFRALRSSVQSPYVTYIFRCYFNHNFQRNSLEFLFIWPNTY